MTRLFIVSMWFSDTPGVLADDFCFDFVHQTFADALERDALQQFIEEPFNQHQFGLRTMNATTHQVVDGLFFPACRTWQHESR